MNFMKIPPTASFQIRGNVYNLRKFQQFANTKKNAVKMGLETIFTAVLSYRILFLVKAGILPLCHVTSAVITLPILDLSEEKTSAHIFHLCISIFLLISHL